MPLRWDNTPKTCVIPNRCSSNRVEIVRFDCCGNIRLPVFYDAQLYIIIVIIIIGSDEHIFTGSLEKVEINVVWRIKMKKSFSTPSKCEILPYFITRVLYYFVCTYVIIARNWPKTTVFYRVLLMFCERKDLMWALLGLKNRTTILGLMQKRT